MLILCRLLYQSGFFKGTELINGHTHTDMDRSQADLPGALMAVVQLAQQ